MRRHAVTGGLWVLVFCATALSICAAQSDRDLATGMKKADADFEAATAKGDKAALAKLLDKDLRWIDFHGQLQTAGQVLEHQPKCLIEMGTLATSDSGKAKPGEKTYEYGAIGDVQENQGRAHVLRVWVKRPDGWKIIVYQEVMSLAAAPTTTPGPGKVCVNPCENTPFKPTTKNDQEVISAYSKLETGAFARNSAVFAQMTADEFVAASSNSNKLYDKRARIEDFNHSKRGGLAPTPLTSARMYDFGDAVLMLSDHTPDHGKALHVTRLWVKEAGHWLGRFSYQTTID